MGRHSTINKAGCGDETKGGVRMFVGGETTRRGNDGGDGDGDNDDANSDSGDDVNFGNVGDGDGSRGWQRW